MASFAYVHTLGGVVARKVADAPRSNAPGATDADAGDEDRSFSDRWFFDSSFDLKHGLIVQEVAPDAFPRETFERLFRR